MTNSIRTFTTETDVIAHGDGDGTIAAAICRRAGAMGRLVCTQPFLLAKLPDLTGPAVIVDLAVDNKNPAATLEWARRNTQHIMYWIDHHPGGEGLAEILNERFIYDPVAPSCPAVMAEHGFDVPTEWLDAANATDRPTKFAPTVLSGRYNAAFKVALVRLQNGDRAAVDVVQSAFVDELMTGNPSTLVTERASAYPALEAATNTAFERLAELLPGVVHADVPEGQGGVDMTSLIVRGYKKAPVVVITTTAANTGEKLVLVGTNKKPDELNLVMAFDLGSGNPSRIVLTGDKANIGHVRSVLGG